MKIQFPADLQLLPVIVQDFKSAVVLMLGYMNSTAFEQTCSTGLVTFYSRSKERLWTKGETSGNFLRVKAMTLDCDNDALLIKADPVGPTCHTGEYSCFMEKPKYNLSFLSDLERVIQSRKTNPAKDSYTSSLFASGPQGILKKLGEELCEFVVEATLNNKRRALEEASDLMFHLMVAVSAQGLSLAEIVDELKLRSIASSE